MPLIAMTREMGSLGNEVARGVAEALGLEVTHHEIIDNLADKMRVRKSHVVRLLDGKASMLERLTADKTSLAIYTEDETYSLAQRNGGAVIRGWGATHLLRPVRHAICVRVCAPLEVRVGRMKERLHTDDEDSVRKEIELSDEAHSAIMRRHFKVDWHDAEHYDLTLNTARVPVKECIEEVLQLVRDPAFAETPESRITLANLSLVAHVRGALRSDRRTRSAGITIQADSGRVTLSGIVDADIELDTLSLVAAGVQGVTQVENKVKQARAFR
jgi:cytidylate kinase